MLSETIGFTGTRNGMTDQQKHVVNQILHRLQPEWCVHGDCIGADTDFHQICVLLRENSPEQFKIRIRPCDITSMRAGNNDYDDEMPVKKPLVRNRDIVTDADLQIGTPSSCKEILRSGTWATLRQARKTGKPLVIVWPDGAVHWENFEKWRKL